MAQDNIPGELKSNYIDLHETTGESYSSIGDRLEANGASETLVKWVRDQKDTHVRGRGDRPVSKSEGADQEREASAAKRAAELKGASTTDAKTPAASATGNPGRRTAADGS